jgi:hypothetical protein
LGKVVKEGRTEVAEKLSESSFIKRQIESFEGDLVNFQRKTTGKTKVKVQ